MTGFDRIKGMAEAGEFDRDHSKMPWDVFWSLDKDERDIINASIASRKARKTVGDTYRGSIEENAAIFQPGRPDKRGMTGQEIKNLMED